ncbi:MAG: PAS domain S-box protein [Pseudomonadota bacterium]
MVKIFKQLRLSLVSKLILSVGLTLFIGISTWAYFNLTYQKQKVMENIVAAADRLSNTIMLGTHYAMMLNSRDDINQIIKNIGKQKEIENIRIYNKKGQIKFSNKTSEVDRSTNIKAEACDVCHRSEPPLVTLNLAQKTRIFSSSEGHRLLGIISPIRNESSCSTDACHVHPEGKQILGALDVVMSLEQYDKEISTFEKGIIALAFFIFILISAVIFLFLFKFSTQPIKKLIGAIQLIAKAEPLTDSDIHQFSIHQNDEMGQLFSAISQMGQRISKKQAKLKKQRDEYQDLFELVPCLITIQNRDYRLISYNHEFSELFNPTPGDYCFRAYKGRDEKCEVCPVERTFEKGRSQYGEETGLNKDGSITHWIARTSPIRNDKDEIVAVMEVCLDITRMKLLEDRLEKSEKKYYAIFNNIPNPVFVLDVDSLKILDCNESVKAVYGYDKDEIINKSILEIFNKEDKDRYASKIKTASALDQVRHVSRGGRTLFVNIRISLSEYPGQKVLLVTTSDITRRLETEQQLIHAGKMATLGEMATGIAHELSQPLSVIKTASSYCMKKLYARERINDEILLTMLEKVDGNVDRASKIIHHMRQFGRKSDMELVEVQVNDVLEKAFEIFSQQLAARGIETIWDIDPNLPRIMAAPDRLEQVFINLILNARDAIEEKWGPRKHDKDAKKITLKTSFQQQSVVVEISDTGTGVSKTIADKIFDPFFTTKGVGKGTGLGLSISYGIIKDCGGEIQLVRQKDSGARFILTFPIQGVE